MNLRASLLISLKVLGVILFILIAGFLIVKALGYQVDPRFFKLTKTGLILIKTNPRQVKVFVDGQFKGEKTPLRLTNILPGWYDIKIEKEGYQSWQKRVEVRPEEAVGLDNIVLFLEKPKIEPITELDKGLLKKLINLLPNPELQIQNQNEIWLEEKLVARFSQPVEQVLFYPDKEHIAFVLEGSLQIIDQDGTNFKKLFPISPSSPFIFLEEGEVVVYQENDKLFKAIIR